LPRVVQPGHRVLVEQVQERHLELQRLVAEPHVLEERQVGLAERRRPPEVAAAVREERVAALDLELLR
jgi:hypothetical protein